MYEPENQQTSQNLIFVFICTFLPMKKNGWNIGTVLIVLMVVSIGYYFWLIVRTVLRDIEKEKELDNLSLSDLQEFEQTAATKNFKVNTSQKYNDFSFQYQYGSSNFIQFYLEDSNSDES